MYTTSYRSVRYIRRLFGHYGVRFDGIINGQRHEDEVQGSHPYPMPTKLPSFYQITLHVDDESVVASYGRTYGFEVFELDAPDDEWAEKIIERADSIRQRKFN